jgi:hypothetical protein
MAKPLHSGFLALSIFVWWYQTVKNQWKGWRTLTASFIKILANSFGSGVKSLLQAPRGRLLQLGSSRAYSSIRLLLCLFLLHERVDIAAMGASGTICIPFTVAQSNWRSQFLSPSCCNNRVSRSVWLLLFQPPAEAQRAVGRRRRRDQRLTLHSLIHWKSIERCHKKLSSSTESTLALITQ